MVKERRKRFFKAMFLHKVKHYEEKMSGQRLRVRSGKIGQCIVLFGLLQIFTFEC